jgi:hypothetical protein
LNPGPCIRQAHALLLSYAPTHFAHSWWAVHLFCALQYHPNGGNFHGESTFTLLDYSFHKKPSEAFIQSIPLSFETTDILTIGLVTKLNGNTKLGALNGQSKTCKSYWKLNSMREGREESTLRMPLCQESTAFSSFSCLNSLSIKARLSKGFLTICVCACVCVCV